MGISRKGRIAIMSYLNVPLSEMDTGKIIESMVSNVCPKCGYAKARDGAFCFICYAELDERQKVALRCRMGEGYQEAFISALKSMDAAFAIIPERLER